MIPGKKDLTKSDSAKHISMQHDSILGSEELDKINMFSSTVKISLRKSEDLSDHLLTMLKSISYEELFTEIINRTLSLDDV